MFPEPIDPSTFFVCEPPLWSS